MAMESHAARLMTWLAVLAVGGVLAALWIAAPYAASPDPSRSSIEAFNRTPIYVGFLRASGVFICAAAVSGALACLPVWFSGDVP